MQANHGEHGGVTTKDATGAKVRVFDRYFSESSDALKRWEQSEYGTRVRDIMLSYGMGGGDVEMILANTWESGWIAGANFNAERRTEQAELAIEAPVPMGVVLIVLGAIATAAAIIAAILEHIL